MPRPATDFRLWLVCSGGLLALAGIGFIVDARAGRHFWTVLAVGVGVCAVMGWVVPNDLVRRGYRLTKPRPLDQAEDRP